MRIFISGACGFIGMHTVVMAASQGCAVTALCSRFGSTTQMPSIPGVRWIAADLRDADRLQDCLSGHDGFIHIAGRYPIWGADPDPFGYLESNLFTTAVTLEACRRAAIRHYVYASSAQVYGRPARIPVHESAPLTGTSVYAASKSSAEALVQSYSSSFGLLGLNLRLFNVYGPGQPAANVVATILQQALRPGVVTINTGEPERDFVYVGDVASALLKAVRCDHAAGQSVNIATGSGITIMELGHRIMKLAGRTDSIVTRVASHRLTVSDPDRLVGDISLAKGLLSWQPSKTLDEGLSLTKDWYDGASQRNGREALSQAARYTI